MKGLGRLQLGLPVGIQRVMNFVMKRLNIWESLHVGIDYHIGELQMIGPA
jgi:hypothetical protein